jgi:hypothetical protein
MWDVGGEGDGVEYVLTGRDEGMEEEAYPEEDKSNRNQEDFQVDVSAY